MAYKAGYFYMPTSSGSFAVSDLGFEPQGVMFMGGNQAVEDTLIHPSNAGAFFGMSWIPVGGGIDQQGLFNGAGDQFNFYPACITCASTGGSVEYRAVLTSHDADGFTLNVTHPAPGSRLIHWLAYGDMDGAGGTNAAQLDGTLQSTVIGYRALTGLMFHFIPSTGGRIREGSGGTFMSMGLSNWPEDESDPPPLGHRTSAGAMTFRQFTQLGAVGYSIQTLHSGSASTRSSITRVPQVIGTMIESWDHHHPTPWPGGGGTQSYELWGPNANHAIAWWTSEGWVTTLGDSPDVGVSDTYTAAPNVPAIEAALFFGTTGYNDHSGSNPNLAYIFGVLTEDYQGCVGFDTGVGPAPANGTPGFFQSRSLCYVDNLHSATGVRAASGEIAGSDVILTGEIAGSAPDTVGSMMQVWGEEEHPDMWIMEV